MKRYLLPLLCGVFLLAGWIAVESNGQSPTAKAHLAAARAAAYEPGQDFTPAFAAVCVAPQPLPAAPPAAPSPRINPPRSQWYAEPAKVFDNLYYVGTKNGSVWAVTTSEGIILIDSNEDFAVEAEVVDGLKKMGLDPANIKYNVITASHKLSYGGAKFLQEHYRTRILISEADWNVIAKDKEIGRAHV